MTNEQIAAALKEAATAATNARTDDDGGTCNFDAAVLNCKGWRQDKIDQINSLCGGLISDKLSSKYWKNYRRLKLPSDGQAVCRTRMAEAGANKLKELGINASVYYQMD